MAFNPLTYENVYGFSVLDELHNFMPEALYDETIFTDEFTAYLRYRVSQLFQPTYQRNSNLYNIYMAQTRRNNFLQWRINRNNRILNPVVVPNIRVEIPVTTPETPPAQVRRRVAADPPPVREANGGDGGAGRSGVTRPPGGDYPPPTRRQRNPFVNASQLLNITGNPGHSNELITFLTGSLFEGLNDLTVRGAWTDVEVFPTNEQIAAGSTIIEDSTVANDINCAICQERNYADSNNSHQWRRLHCNHQFHRECVDSWFERSIHCPVCRADIREPVRESVD